MINIKKNSISIEIGAVIILTCIFMIIMCSNLIRDDKKSINNFSTINRVDMHPSDSLRFKFI